jgi:hypothetical protein
MRFTRLASVVFALACSAATLAACRSESEPSPTSFLGLWNRDINEADATALAPNHAGVWSLRFRQNGVLVAYEPVGAHVEGVRDTIWTTFSTTARDRLVVGAGPGCPTEGVYRWKLADGFLKIRKVIDVCPLRAAVIPGDWSRSRVARLPGRVRAHP